MLKEQLLKFMPMLEEDGSGGSGGTDPEPKDPDGGDPKKPEPKDPEPAKKYTDEDLDRILNQKFAKWEKNKQKEIDEAKKLSNMSAEEKAKHAEDKAAEAQRKLARIEMKGTARSILSKSDIRVSEGILDYLVAEDTEKTKENIESFAKVFNESVEAEVKRQLAGKTPKGGTGSKTMTREEIEKIADPVARQKAIAENLSLFK